QVALMKSLICSLLLAGCSCLPVSAQVSIALIAPRQVAVAEILPIAEAIKKPFGSVVTVAGRVTVAAQFGGPAYLQDGTGGIAVFEGGLHGSVQIGDSIVVTGPYVEFGADSEPGSGLGQISGQGITWEVADVQPLEPAAQAIGLSEVGEA